jgi:tRNA pseudouridine55 synthase
LPTPCERAVIGAVRVTGLLVVDKAAGSTSHDVVARLRKVLSERRVGHAGTLDPDATGVLLVGVGRCTRLLRFLSASSKAYRGTVAFGVATDTLDASGRVVERTALPVSREEVEQAARRFVGHIHQIPPMVSAVKVGGRRLHEIARAGGEVERVPRPVRIDRIVVESFVDGPYPEATLVVECGPGTYVRTLASDLGSALGGGAHLKDLRRLRVGTFTLADAHSLEEIAADPETTMLTTAEAMRDLAALHVSDDVARAVVHGATFPARAVLPDDAGPGPFAVLDGRDRLLAVYERRGAGVKPSVVVASPEEAA